MKIFFDNVNFSSSSGPNTFAYRLAATFHEMGHEITSNSHCDIHLAFIEQTCPKNDASKLVQRLDGIWFKPEEFVDKNMNIKSTYDRSDFIIWQTSFDKKMITKHWGDKTGNVIANGIKLELVPVVHPELIKIREKFDTIFVSAANWHRQKRLKENIEMFESLQETYKNSCLLVVGSTPDATTQNSRVFYLGNLGRDVLMQVYALSDWMIHLAWLDHCPNTVVESLSQKTPVICASSGGTREIVKNNGLVIEEDVEYKFQLTDYENPSSITIPNGVTLPHIEVDYDHLCITKVAKKYENDFMKIK